MKQWLKKITGIEAEEKRIAEEKAALEAESDKKLKVRDPKAYATKKGEPWVNVLDMKVNEDNIRNGFFELDWNNEFIEQLLDAGYKGETNEQIVDAWFRTIVTQMLDDEGLDTNREMGYINVVPIDKGRSSVS